MLETFLFIVWVLFIILWVIFAILALVTHDRVCLTLMWVFIIIVNILCIAIILI